jgi:nucleoside-diphosphate-sugar epimerase
MRTILVTGVAGYIGSVLTGHLLAEGVKVIGVDNLMFRNGHAILGYMGNQNFEFYHHDVRDWTYVNKLATQADIVIPLAALVGAPICSRLPDEATHANFIAIRNLVTNLSPRQRVVFPNTNSGYGQTDGTTQCTEQDALTPISHYGRTKCDAEHIVLERDNAVVMRLATVFGVSPRMRFDLLVNDFTERLHRIRDGKTVDRTLTIFEPHYKRNFVGVQDIARAFLFMASRQWLRGIFNVGLDEANLSKIQLAHRICDTIGLDRDVVVTGEGTDPDQRNYLVSSAKIEKENFVFHHTLTCGIQEVAQMCDMFDVEATSHMRNA